MSISLKENSIHNILINSLWSLIAGITGSIIILVITFAISGIISIPETFSQAQHGIETRPIFPIVLSIITLLWTTITLWLTYKIAHLTDPERYKENDIIMGQIAFFAFLTYLFITPIYIIAGLENYQNLMIVFLVHTSIVILGTHIILEILNNYRNILLWIYGSFVGFFISSILTALIFSAFSSGLAKLISLILLIPLINFSISLVKQLFELLYFHYNAFTNLDPLGDIFYQMEIEEKENEKIEIQKNAL